MILHKDRLTEQQSAPAVKHLLTQLFPSKTIRQSTLEEDRNTGADWFAGNLKIAVRTRDASYSPYFGDFTIRESRPSGFKTELEKIHDNEWADFYFYGFWQPEAQKIASWYILRMGHFDENARYKIMGGNHAAVVRIYSIHDQPDGFIGVIKRLDGTICIPQVKKAA